MNSSATVHIIDDDESIRYAIASLLRTVGLNSAGYNSAQEFLDKAELDGPGCLMLDVRLPGMNGLDFQDRLAEQHILCPVILMSGHADVPMSVRGMKAGAIDFLTKPFRDQDILDAVTSAIARDEARLSQQLNENQIQARYARLSPREQQVTELVVQGKMNKQVAAILNISEITVKIHRGSAMRKLEARTLADMVRLVERVKASATA
ncbi:response regulator transcription factor [Roseateles noduli]|uniref:response regulator transcription factor n=1 Tax=Roseateles noduli TaxID=2052484 RepID=UPI003D64D4E1